MARPGSSWMSFRLAQRRTVWFPTLFGWACALVGCALVVGAWFFYSESFLRVTDNRPSEIFVVEAWIGNEALRAAAVEFAHRDDRFLLSTGGLSSERWSDQRYSYADMAARELVRSGVPADRIIATTAATVSSQRTYEMAAAAWRTLREKNLHPRNITVFTVGPHARRSRLVFSKVFGSETHVGVIAWVPPSYSAGPWWSASERADDVLKETAGYLYELFLNSGRWSNAPTASTGASSAKTP
ncbi:MAG: hypothetical protein JWM35_2591 [Verrucomicrobia bacterium]|nr:hypothetical protein [Verrucomicrobiota bacterium]